MVETEHSQRLIDFLCLNTNAHLFIGTSRHFLGAAFFFSVFSRLFSPIPAPALSKQAQLERRRWNQTKHSKIIPPETTSFSVCRWYATDEIFYRHRWKSSVYKIGKLYQSLRLRFSDRRTARVRLWSVPWKKDLPLWRYCWPIFIKCPHMLRGLWYYFERVAINRSFTSSQISRKCSPFTRSGIHIWRHRKSKCWSA